jgi:hypothetical protein
MATVTDRGSATGWKNLGAFLLALLILLSILIGAASCGDDDLILPGELPFTPTPDEEDPTNTPEEDEDDV